MSILINRREMFQSAGLGALALSLNGIVGRTVSADTLPPANSGPYELPPLPYAFDSLAPAIEEKVLRLHYTKHHAGYVKGLNATLKKLSRARTAGDFSRIKSLSRDLAFHGSGHVLHSLYWQSMAPCLRLDLGTIGPKLPVPLRQTLERDFGSLEAFRDQFLTAAKKVEGSGWAVLAYEPLGARLVVLQVEKHQNLTIWGVVPLLVCDVWEHAYYAQYQNRRGEYVDNFYKLINWPAVAGRYSLATSGSGIVG